MNVNLVLHKSKKRSTDGRHPVVIRITKDRKTKDRVVKGHYYHAAEWNNKTNLPKGASSAVKKMLSKEVTKYIDAEAEFEGMDVSLEAIIDKAKGNKQSAPSVLCYYRDIINRFTKAKQIKTASTYKGAMVNFKTFMDDNNISDELRFVEITVSLLNNYKTWLDGAHERTFKDGRVESYEIKDTTKHIYLRTLRSLYNKAIADKYARESNYPFKEFFKDLHFDTQTEKKAITSDDIAKIAALDLSDDPIRQAAQRYFLFGYYGMGINFKDIALLKWKNVVDGNILYKREKLKRKKGKQKVFSIPVQGMIKEILAIYSKSKIIEPDNYIFPVLNKLEHDTAQKQYDRTTNVITRVNRDLKKIGLMAGIKKPLSTYTWRHTAFSVLKLEKGIPIAMISQAAGHSSVAVTEIYLDSFGTDAEQEVYNAL